MARWTASRIRRKATALAALGLTLAAGILTEAQPAAAATVDCNVEWHNYDSGGGYVDEFNIYLRTGPYGACPAIQEMNPGLGLYYHCYYLNAYNNRWTHARIAGTDIQGWVYSGNLDDGGATKPCFY